MTYCFDFTEGCVCYSYLVNDKEFVDTPSETVLDILETLIMDVSDAKVLFSILEVFLYDCPKYGHLAKYSKLADLWAIYMKSFSDTENEWDKDRGIIDKYLETFDKDKTYWLKDCILYFVETYFDKLDKGSIQQIVIDLVQTNKNTVKTCSDEPCECCGDYITNYKLKIENGEDYFDTEWTSCDNQLAGRRV